MIDEVNDIADHARRPLIDEEQLRDAAGSIAANIRESNGRRGDGEKRQFFRYALGSAEEADDRMRTNFAARRIESKRYWKVHNRLVVIRKMIESLIA